VTACLSPSLPAPSDQPSPVARADGARHELRAELRRELFSAVMHCLHGSGIPYCLLGAADDSAVLGESDLDFAVSPSDYARIPQLLAHAAARVGGGLIQAMRHETTATYFVIAKTQGDTLAFLNPDCISDYRREGRLWMRTEELLRDRCAGAGGFYHPAADVDFKYYLIKQVLKQTLTDAQWAKLRALYHQSSDPEFAFSLWRQPSNLQIESALLRDDRAAFHALAPRLRNELESTPCEEDAVARAAAFVADTARFVSRVSHPTGLFVRIINGHLSDRINLALRLGQAMAPAFRRTWIDCEFSPASINHALIASTLVVSPNKGLLGRAPAGVDITWQCALSATANLQRAIAVVVSHLADRTMRRLKMPPQQSCPTLPELATLGDGAL
jgi:hypothetical protein